MSWRCLILAFAAVSCTLPPEPIESTQAVVRVRTDAELDLQRIDVELFDFTGTRPGGSSSFDASELVDRELSFGIVPSANEESFVATASGYRRDGTLVITRSIRGGFAPKRTLYFRLWLSLVCADESCPGEQTCTSFGGAPLCTELPDSFEGSRDPSLPSAPPATSVTFTSAHDGDASGAEANPWRVYEEDFMTQSASCERSHGVCVSTRTTP